jgi:hypothetical protein
VETCSSERAAALYRAGNALAKSSGSPQSHDSRGRIRPVAVLQRCLYRPKLVTTYTLPANARPHLPSMPAARRTVERGANAPEPRTPRPPEFTAASKDDSFASMEYVASGLNK